MSVGMALGYWTLARQLEARSALEISGKLSLVIHLLSETPTAAELSARSHRFSDVLVGHDDTHLALVDARTGAELASFSPSARESVASLDALGAGDRRLRWKSREGATLDAVTGLAPAADGGMVRYYLSLDRSHDAQLLRGFLRASLLGVPILLVVIALGAWMIASTGMAPLRRFHRLAATIGTQSLDQRVPEDDLPAELHELAREFNAMLERIDQGYRRLQEFSADLAHELRTPLSILLGRHQVALSQPRSPAQLRDVLEGDVEELERLSRLIADMLFIAQAEHSHSALKRERVDLRAEAERVAEYLSPVAEEKNVRLKVHGSGAVQADRLLVQRALTNLVSNAVQHADPGTTVQVEIEPVPHAVRLSVANRGDTIPADHIERIFDRFHRVDASRTRQSGGSGLGLAIVRSIMTAHAGQVAVASDRHAGKTVFTLRFPQD